MAQAILSALLAAVASVAIAEYVRWLIDTWHEIKRNEVAIAALLRELRTNLFGINTNKVVLTASLVSIKERKWNTATPSDLLSGPEKYFTFLINLELNHSALESMSKIIHAISGYNSQLRLREGWIAGHNLSEPGILETIAKFDQSLLDNGESLKVEIISLTKSLGEIRF